MRLLCMGESQKNRKMCGAFACLDNGNYDNFASSLIVESLAGKLL